MSLVLVIDDSRMLRQAAALALGQDGHDVIEAADGQDGLERARTDRPDVILCDIGMPVMDGHEFLTLLRADASVPYIPVIMVTSHDDRTQMRRAMTAGADDYLVKPYTFQELREAVRAVRQRRDSQRGELEEAASRSFAALADSQKDSIAGQYEHRLIEEINARWDQAGSANQEEHFGQAAVVLVDIDAPALLAAGAPGAGRARLVHLAAQEALLSLGAARVLPFGNDVVGVFPSGTARTAGAPSPADAAALCRQAVEAARFVARELPPVAWATDEATAGGMRPLITIAVSFGDLTLMHVSDPLHGDADSVIATGVALFDAEAVLEGARGRGLPLACSAAVASGLTPDDKIVVIDPGATPPV